MNRLVTNIFNGGHKKYLDYISKSNNDNTNCESIKKSMKENKINFYNINGEDLCLLIPNNNKIKWVKYSEYPYSKNNEWTLRLKPTKEEKKLFWRYHKAWKLMDK